MDITRIFDGKWKYLAAYLSFKLSVRDKTPNWWIFPNTNLEHKYFEKLKKFCYLAKLWVFRSFTPWWKMIFGVSNLPKFRTFFIHYYHKMFHPSISGMGSTHNSLPWPEAAIFISQSMGFILSRKDMEKCIFIMSKIATVVRCKISLSLYLLPINVCNFQQKYLFIVWHFENKFNAQYAHVLTRTKFHFTARKNISFKTKESDEDGFWTPGKEKEENDE